MNNYERLIADNLKKAFSLKSIYEMEKDLGAEKKEDHLFITAFGEPCTIKPNEIIISGKKDTGPIALIISLYTLNASNKKFRLEPFISFKDIPGSMPYHGAFHANTERVLIPYVELIYEKKDIIIKKIGTEKDIHVSENVGDFSFILFPLPKIALRYIFYFPDEEFPASVTCLFSNNASSFLPLDALADLAEYTSKKIIKIICD